MRPILSHRTRQQVTTVLSPVWRLLILLLPTGLLLLACVRYPGQDNIMLWMGAAFQALVCVLSFMSRRTWNQPIGPSVVTLYLIALAWLWFGSKYEDWYIH